MNKICKAIIPVAGFGTRFLPFTKAVPKEMLPIVDVPTLQYIVEECVASGITEILLVLGKNKKCIEDHFDRVPELESLLSKNGKVKEVAMVKNLAKMANFYYVRQSEMNGSANAVALAKAFVGDDPFAVLYGDDIVYSPANPCIGQLIKAYEQTGKTIVGVQNVPKNEVYKYGIVKPGSIKGSYTELVKIIEKPTVEDAPSTLASMGRYIFNPDIFEAIKKTHTSANGEVYLTDSIQIICDEVGAFAYTFEGIRYDVGDKLGFLQATCEYGLRREELGAEFKKYLIELVKGFNS